MHERLVRAIDDALVRHELGHIVDATRVHGGDVAQSFRVRFAGGRTVFAKTHLDPPPGFFVTEAAGLQWLREASAVAVPEVLAVADGGGPDDDGPTALLVLEWIDESSRAAPDETTFGRSLAALHAAGAPCFGRVDGRPTGSRSLPNDPCATWPEQFAERRLLPLVRMARDAQVVDDRVLRAVERIAGRLTEVEGSDEPPARLHGDLWAGNRIVDDSGRSWLIDPACFGGHREFDLAMMRLFGGFGAAAFGAYEDVRPLAPGWQARVPLHQLAPLLVHAIKFGGGYPAAVGRAVEALGTLSR
jgi:fructosamine-3-kinase